MVSTVGKMRSILIFIAVAQIAVTPTTADSEREEANLWRDDEFNIQNGGDEIQDSKNDGSWWWYSTIRRWWETNRDSSCGGYDWGNNGTIVSPNYPSYYPNNVDCEWVVEAEYGSIITVTIESFETEECCDYLEIRDGLSNNGTVLARLSGNNITNDTDIEEIVSSSNGLYFSFVSDYSIQGRGFELHWVSDSAPCGGFIEGKEGTVMSPNYPQLYPRNSSCVWEIVATEGATITVKFESFDLEEGWDYLEIRDYFYPGDPLLLELTGYHNTVADITSTGRALYVHFTSDYSGQRSGFKFNWFAEGGYTTEPWTEGPSTPPSGGLQCYSCIGCDYIDDDTNVISSEDYLACFVAVEIGHDHFVFRGGSPDYFEDGSCRHEADGAIVCYCTHNMCNDDAAMERMLMLGQ